MYCPVCGEKLALYVHEQEGLVPYCKHCGEYRFPQFATAVSMVVTNRDKNKILLAKHNGQDDFVLFAGYVKKGETAEKTVTREFREETKLNVVKHKYMSSLYHEPHNVLMLNFLVIAENGELTLDKSELEEAVWFSFDEALASIRKESVAETFLINAISELKKQNNI
ncbi:MAG: NUDIX domain-containing protein [Candidatus Coproplasma sp.]